MLRREALDANFNMPPQQNNEKTAKYAIRLPVGRLEMDPNGFVARMARKVVAFGRKRLYGEFWPFTALFYEAISKARLEHLASLNLDLSKKSVLEVGAGVGLLTKFFEDRGCTVLSTDGNPENVRAMRLKYAWRKAELLDLDRTSDLSKLGQFDIVFCYGTLYHLSKPREALKALSNVCREMILLETCVAPGKYPELHLIRDPVGRDQATSGIGCRPNRAWVMEVLRETFGYAYLTRTQPDHPDFPLDWDILPFRLTYRAVFIGSKHPLRNPDLLEEVPQHQQKVP